MKVRDLLRQMEQEGWYFARQRGLEGLALYGQPLPLAKTRLIEVPEDGFAEWLHVELPFAEAISA